MKIDKWEQTPLEAYDMIQGHMDFDRGGSIELYLHRIIELENSIAYSLATIAEIMMERELRG